jgi:hypothetical protein
MMRNFLCLFLYFSLTSCGGYGDLNVSKINYWQTYSASNSFGVHLWFDVDQNYSIYDIGRVNNNFRTGYGFLDLSGNLIYKNHAMRRYYARQLDASHQQVFDVKQIEFTHAGRRYFSKNNKSIESCPLDSNAECDSIEIMIGSFPYVYAESKGHVIVITNWGDAVVYDGHSWCRMSRSELDVFVCNEFEPMVTVPRKIQFYSSIQYQGEVLLGEWPTGSIYTFDGIVLKPSEKWTPPPLRNREKIGFEAQSMAEYCGDLFVGYWPKGEVWRYSRRDNVWVYFKRLFTPVVNEGFLPWADRSPDGLPGAFFGQRVSALVPYEDSLYAFTSNLHYWNDDIFVDALSQELQDEYGKIWKITGLNCKSVYK